MIATTANLITRDILGNVPQWLIRSFYIVTFSVCAVVLFLLFKRISRYWRARGTEGRERQSWAKSPGSLFASLTFHRQLLRSRYAGMAHLLTFYGFVILFIGTCLVFLEHQTPLHFFYGYVYLISSLIIDLGGVALMVGIGMFLWRRYLGQTRRMLTSAWASTMSWLLLAIALSGFLLEGARIARDMPLHEKWSPVGYSVALMMHEVGIAGESSLPWHTVLWAGHALFCIAFFALLPGKFYRHIFFSIGSRLWRRKHARAQLRTPVLAGQTATRPGAQSIDELPWVDLLQADACTACGRCNDVCPATAAGKVLQPRDVVLAIQDRDEAFSTVGDEALWACTTCGACNHVCPVGIEIYDKIVELRRGHVESGEVPTIAQEVFESSVDAGNPFQKTRGERMLWARGLNVPVAAPEEDVELLYWVGCAGSFDPEGQKISQAMIEILHHLGVRFHILGCREGCTGDPARRMGEEGLFHKLARENVALLKSHSVRKILTHCPHCFNTFKNEYPQFDGNFEVEHHSQFLWRMIQAGKLQLRARDQEKLTFHDPCYLGRGNGEFQAPREVLNHFSKNGVTEMPRHGYNSYCCGAGGGSMWLDISGSNRIENIRAKEAADTGARVISTACPFCKVMITTGKQSLDNGKHFHIKDLAELVAEQIATKAW